VPFFRHPALAGVSAELRIRARSHHDIHGSVASNGVEFSDGLSGDAEIFGQLRYTKADEGSVQGGAIGGLGLGSINDTGKRVSYPVSIGVRFA
jgi:hypothetical protein